MASSIETPPTAASATAAPKATTLSTHVLDQSNGVPAAGIRVVLSRNDGAAGWTQLTSAVTNKDGRCPVSELTGSAILSNGEYELMFHAGEYLRAKAALPSARPDFLDLVPIRFLISDAGTHYHVPLLLSPFGFATYRGS